MDRQEYLNQISAQNRPPKQPSKIASILTSKFFMIGMGAVVLMILMMIVGSLIGNSGENNVKKLNTLKFHIENTSSVIGTYQRNIKSSILRSSSASLASILSNTNRDLTDYIEEKYPNQNNDALKDLSDEATLAKDGLEADLFEAKINGILDRVYAHKMSYEISMIMTEEAGLYEATKDESLQEILTTSYSSLEKLHDAFNDFSETK